MRLTLDALLVLDAIERKGSFAAAAEALYRVPSAITYSIQKLESDLGVQLFDRSGHRAKLTPAGEALLREGRHLLHAAHAAERLVKRVATGWESELRIAVCDLLDIQGLFPLLEQFYAVNCGTMIRLSVEVLSGTWDALHSGRADLVVGAVGDAPIGQDYRTQILGTVPFVFVLASQHPLAQLSEPLEPSAVRQYRAVAVADSSRYLPVSSVALLDGQEVLTVPDMATKLAAHRQGLGVGYVPLAMAQADLAEGRLLHKQTVSAAPQPLLHLAWRDGHQGQALPWWLERLSQPAMVQTLLGTV